MTNTGDSPVQMRKVFIEPQMEVYISRDNLEFEQWWLDAGIPGDDFRDIEVFEVNESITCFLRVGYDKFRPETSAFPEAGMYWVKSRFPYDGFRSRLELESNRVYFRVSQPEAHALEMWQRVKEEKFRAFMHDGDASKEVALEAARIMKSFDDTSYHGALRWALGEFYRRRPDLDPQEKELIREVTGMAAPSTIDQDVRLDQLIKIHFPERTPRKKVYQEISERSGVPLELHPKSMNFEVAIPRLTLPLRHFMRQIEGPYQKWVRKGDGYVLAPSWAEEADE